MKDFSKIMEILNDKDNWTNDICNGIMHTPTGINCYSGILFYKDSHVIYEAPIFLHFFTTAKVDMIKKYLDSKNPSKLENIYNDWKNKQN
jgi:hypothetical protein